MEGVDEVVGDAILKDVVGHVTLLVASVKSRSSQNTGSSALEASISYKWRILNLVFDKFVSRPGCAEPVVSNTDCCETLYSNCLTRRYDSGVKQFFLYKQIRTTESKT